MPRHKHLKVPSSNVVKTGNALITPLDLVINPFGINEIKLQMHVLICDNKIPSVGPYLGELTLEHLQFMQGDTNRQLHIKQTIILLIIMKRTNYHSNAQPL